MDRHPFILSTCDSLWWQCWFSAPSGVGVAWGALLHRRANTPGSLCSISDCLFLGGKIYTCQVLPHLPSPTSGTKQSPKRDISLTGTKLPHSRAKRCLNQHPLGTDSACLTLFGLSKALPVAHHISAAHRLMRLRVVPAAWNDVNRCVNKPTATSAPPWAATAQTTQLMVLPFPSSSSRTVSPRGQGLPLSGQRMLRHRSMQNSSLECCGHPGCRGSAALSFAPSSPPGAWLACNLQFQYPVPRCQNAFAFSQLPQMTWWELSSPHCQSTFPVIGMLSIQHSHGAQPHCCAAVLWWAISISPNAHPLEKTVTKLVSEFASVL